MTLSTFNKMSLPSLLSLLAVLAVSDVSFAQQWSRSGKAELSGLFQTMSSHSVSSADLAVRLDDAAVFGLGLAGNVNDHINLNTEFLFGTRDITGTYGSTTVEADAHLFVWNVNVDYNVLKDRLTPVLSAGVGLIRQDGTVSGFPFDETDFSYNLGAGLRWDILDNLMLKAMYRITWSELEDVGRTRFDGFTIGLAYMW